MTGEKDVKVKLSADTKEAVRALRDFERQVNRLGDMADQGKRRQGGFLSSKQVQTYRNILKEMENTYQQHLNSLEKMEDRYNQRKSSPQIKQAQELHRNLKRRQELYRNSTGGNKWGDVASPVVQEYHRQRLEDAQQSLSSYKSSAQYKDTMADLKRIESEINVLRSAVSNMGSERSRGMIHSGRIGSMHEQDPVMRRYVNGAMQTVSATGAIIGFNKYWNYTMQGIGVLRGQERGAGVISQKLGSYTGSGADARQREYMQPIGEASNYDIGQTAQLQGVIVSGGTDGNRSKLNSDTFAVQRFSRAYSVDANSMAQQGAVLQQMGTFKEGQQQRFADMIAGAISKEGMHGREEEMIRATTSLAESVSKTQVGLSQGQFSNLLGLQTQLGQAIPSLKGDRGAQVLSNMDNAMKAGSPQLDLIMGKGTLPQFTGLQGYANLKRLEERGIADPQASKYLLQGLDRQFGTGQQSEIMKSEFLAENGFMTRNEYDSLRDSGFLAKMKSGQTITSKELEKAGLKDLAKQWKTYENSQTGKQDHIDSTAKDFQADHAKAADSVSKFFRGMWADTPETLKHMLLPTASIGGGIALGWGQGKLLRNGASWLTKKVRPNISGEGGIGSLISEYSSLRTSRLGTLAQIASKSGNWLKSSAGAVGDWFKGLGGGKLLGGSAKGLSKSPSWLSAGSNLPVIGTMLSIAGERIANPKESWGRSIAKGLGSGIGAGVGAGMAEASGLFTEGAGWLGIPFMAAGGSVAGEGIGDWIYSLFAGDGKKKKSSKSKPTASASYFDGNSTRGAITASLASASKDEHVVKIVIAGKIDGMSKNNEDEVKDSMKDYFKQLLSHNGLDLSYDQTRT